jgi:hypothetical protein
VAKESRREQRADLARERRIQDLREFQDACEVQAGLLGRFYIERGKSDAAGIGPTAEIEATIHAFTEGNLRLHKLRARFRDDATDQSVRKLMEAVGELAKTQTARGRQRQILYETIDPLLVGMQERIGGLLAIQDSALATSQAPRRPWYRFGGMD